jgi:flagellar basal-body rod protein FlgG
MIDALYASATGMIAQQTSMDVIANNLANATTVGYKRDRMDLVDLDYVPFRLPDGGDGQLGLGSAPGEVGKEMAQGLFQSTGRALDVAVQGDGFLQVTRPDGSLAYTRAGNLQVDGQGRLVMPTGELLQPRITVPPNASEPTIGPDGTVTAQVNGQIQRLGALQLATFANTGGLQAVGNNLFVATANSGAPQTGAGGTGARGTIVQGVLESSNVQLATEMVNMVTTQRAFEAASRVVSATDEMWGIANGLRR